MILEEKGVERGASTEISTDGNPLKVIVGTASNRASRPQNTCMISNRAVKNENTYGQQKR